MAFVKLTWLEATGTAPITYQVRYRQTPATVSPSPTPPTPPPTIVESSQSASVTSTTGSIINSELKTWTLVSSVSSGLQIAVNGVVDTTTANVTLLLYFNHLVYQQNTAGNFYYKDLASDTWAQTSDPRVVVVTPSSGQFYIVNGQIVDPNGKTFIARGMNVYSWQLSQVCTNAACAPLTTLFPGVNFIRLAMEDTYPTNFEPMVSQLTSHGIVIAFEDHTGISQPPYTGGALTTELNWYAALAAQYKNNPYVWFGTFNEPGNGNNLAGIATQELAIYNAIRNAGNNNIILMEEPSGGNVGLVGANSVGYDGLGPMTPYNYLIMKNIVWDLHFYGYVVNYVLGNYSTNISAIQTVLMGSAAGAYGILACQTMRSQDGLVPVLIGEFGTSTDDISYDPNGTQVVQAVCTSGYGYAAWNWISGGNIDHLTDGNNNLTPFGQQLAGYIKAQAGV